MKNLIAAAFLIMVMVSSAHASDDRTISTCALGDAYIGLQVATNRQVLKAVICQYTSCEGHMNRTGRLQPVDSEGNRKTYEMDGSAHDQLVLFFDADGDVMEVQQFEDNVMIQRYEGCRTN